MSHYFLQQIRRRNLFGVVK